MSRFETGIVLCSVLKSVKYYLFVAFVHFKQFCVEVSDDTGSYFISISHNKATENENYELGNVLICIYNFVCVTDGYHR